VDRRRFDHLFSEISLVSGAGISRFRLWLYLRESGAEPDDLSRSDAIAFCRTGTREFAQQEGLQLTLWQRYRLLRRIAAFEPAHATPVDHFDDLDPREDL